MRTRQYAYLLLILALLFNLAAVDCPPTDTPPPPDTSTPAPPPTDEPTPTSPPDDTATPYPQSEPTPTVGVSPDPSPSPAVGTGTPDGERHPTPQTTLPVTGGGMPPNVALGLTVIAGIILLFVAAMARRARNVTH